MKSMRAIVVLISYAGIIGVTAWMVLVLAFAFLASPPKIIHRGIKLFDRWLDEKENAKAF